MSLIVQKYGGTSVGTLERILAVADRVGRGSKAGHQLVVVVSAMAGETNRLLELAGKLAVQPFEREVDVLLSTGEQETAALLAIALQERGYAARSFLGHQIRIDTDSAFGRARIRSIDGERLRSALQRGEIAVVAGFRASTKSTTSPRWTRRQHTWPWPSRRLKADVCEIYTDVGGVYTSDPRICPGAQAAAHQPRRDARAGQPGRQGAADPIGGVRQALQRAAARALELRRQ
jgi:aspartate kinase